MCTLSAEERDRDEELAPFLRRYREAALRDISRERLPARLKLVETIQEALEKGAEK